MLQVRRRRLATLQAVVVSEGKENQADSDAMDVGVDTLTPEDSKVRTSPHSPCADTSPARKFANTSTDAPSLSVSPSPAPETPSTPTRITTTTTTTTRESSDGTVIVIRTINLALEGIFQVTLRKDKQSALKCMSHISSDEFLSSTNISEVLCSRLSGDVEVGGAIAYLASCYKRLQLKITTVTDKVKEDLTL